MAPKLVSFVLEKEPLNFYETVSRLSFWDIPAASMYILIYRHNHEFFYIIFIASVKNWDYQIASS